MTDEYLRARLLLRLLWMEEATSHRRWLFHRSMAMWLAGQLALPIELRFDPSTYRV